MSAFPKRSNLVSWPRLGINPEATALMVVDMQIAFTHPDYGTARLAKEKGVFGRYAWYFRRLPSVIQRTARLIELCRQSGCRVIFTAIACEQADCGDASLLHRRVGLLISKISPEARIVPELPTEGSLVVWKTSSGSFCGSNLDYKLRNMGVRTLLVTGVVTNYCVESTVREAADLGFDVFLVSDATAAYTQVAQQAALAILDGAYCTVVTARDVGNLLRDHHPQRNGTAKTIRHSSS